MFKSLRIALEHLSDKNTKLNAFLYSTTCFGPADQFREQGNFLSQICENLLLTVTQSPHSSHYDAWSCCHKVGKLVVNWPGIDQNHYHVLIWQPTHTRENTEPFHINCTTAWMMTEHKLSKAKQCFVHGHAVSARNWLRLQRLSDLVKMQFSSASGRTRKFVHDGTKRHNTQNKVCEIGISVPTLFTCSINVHLPLGAASLLEQPEYGHQIRFIIAATHHKQTVLC